MPGGVGSFSAIFFSDWANMILIPGIQGDLMHQPGLFMLKHGRTGHDHRLSLPYLK